MKPPFTVEQFLAIFKRYNEAVFPFQMILFAMGVITIYLAFKPNRISDNAIITILALLWMWMGITYHIVFFSIINPAAYFFGILFIIQGIIFLLVGLLQNKLLFRIHKDIYGITGIFLMLLALIIYPLLGIILGHIYPTSPTFGLPCPTTIFTFGLLLLNEKKTPALIIVIPLMWSIIGFMAAFQFGILEDYFLLISSLLTVSLLMYRNKELIQMQLAKN